MDDDNPCIIEVDFQNKKKLFKLTFEQSVALRKKKDLDKAIENFLVVTSQCGFKPAMDNHIIKCVNSMKQAFEKYYTE